MINNTINLWDTQIFQEQQGSQNLSIIHYMQGLHKYQPQHYEGKQLLLKDQTSNMIQEQQYHIQATNKLHEKLSNNLIKQLEVGRVNKSDFYQNIYLKKQQNNRLLSYESVLNLNKGDLITSYYGCQVKNYDSNREIHIFSTDQEKSDNFNQKQQQATFKKRRRNKSQFWNDKEVLKFNLFLLLVYQRIQENSIQKFTVRRVKWNFFKDMAQFVGSKNNIQCRTRYNRKIKQKQKLYSIQGYLYKGLLKIKIDSKEDNSLLHLNFINQINDLIPSLDFAKKYRENLDEIQSNISKIINHVKNSCKKKLDTSTSSIQQNSLGTGPGQLSLPTSLKNSRKLKQYKSKEKKTQLNNKSLKQRHELITENSSNQYAQFVGNEQNKRLRRKPAQFWKKQQTMKFDLFLLLQYQNIYEDSLECEGISNESNKKNKRTKWCFFKDMGYFIGNKANTQCRSRFYRKIKQKSNIPTIQAYLYEKFLSSQEDFDSIIYKLNLMVQQALLQCQDQQKFRAHTVNMQLNLRTIKDTIQNRSTSSNKNRKFNKAENQTKQTEYATKRMVQKQLTNNQLILDQLGTDKDNKNGLSFYKQVDKLVKDKLV